MRLGKEMKAILKNPKIAKLGFLESLDMVINFYSSVVIKEGIVKPLIKALNNNRDERARPETSQKDQAMILLQNTKGGNAFGLDSGAFGKLWLKVFKNCQVDHPAFMKDSLPTFEEMMDGVFKLYLLQMDTKMPKASKQQKIKIETANKTTWNKLIQKAGITNPMKKLKLD